MNIGGSCEDRKWDVYLVRHFCGIASGWHNITVETCEKWQEVSLYRFKITKHFVVF